MAFCDLLGITALDERQRLLRVIQNVDAQVVDHHRSEKDAEGKRARSRTA